MIFWIELIFLFRLSHRFQVTFEIRHRQIRILEMWCSVPVLYVDQQDVAELLNCSNK